METKYMDAVEYFVENYGEFLWQVLFPIFLWLALVLGFIILLFVKFTFGKWTKDHPNPYQTETFGMPRGTFRGILTLSLLWVTVILELVNVRIIGFEQEFTGFMTAFQMMIAFYFGAKVMHHITSSDVKKTKAETGTTDSTVATDESGEIATDEEAVG
jgi:hypothetical protein